MKGIRYILILLTLCVAVISCERDEVHRYPIEGTGKLIQFSVESEWPELSKAAINSVEDMKRMRSKVWGIWNQNPGSQYFSNESAAVYQPTGTDFYFENNEWKCQYDAEWHEGYYNFAAFYPNMQGNHSSEFTKTTSAGSTTIEYKNELEFSFKDFSLGGNQIDCMYAFSNVDNSAETAETVNLNFEHLFSLLTINIAANKTTDLPQKIDITIYGIHKSITGTVTIAQTEVITKYGTPDQQRTITTTNNIQDLLDGGVVTDETLFYKKSTFTNDKYGSVDIITPVSQWVVFPENLEKTPLTIKVDFKDNDGTVTETMRATVNTGEWESGKSYVYTLLTD